MAEPEKRRGGQLQLLSAIRDARAPWITAPMRAVLFVLTSFADVDGRCWPSQETIAESTGLSPRTVWTALRVLVERTVIELVEKGRQHRPAIYSVALTPERLRLATAANLSTPSLAPVASLAPSTVAPVATLPAPPDSQMTASDSQTALPDSQWLRQKEKREERTREGTQGERASTLETSGDGNLEWGIEPETARARLEGVLRAEIAELAAPPREPPPDPLGDHHLGSAWATGVGEGSGTRPTTPKLGQLRPLRDLVRELGPETIQERCEWLRERGRAYGEAHRGLLMNPHKFVDWINSNCPAPHRGPGMKRPIIQPVPPGGRIWKTADE